MIAKFALLERDKRRLARLRRLFDSQAADAHKMGSPATAATPQFLELARTISSLEKGFDPPVCDLEFRNLIRHD